jgi:hypothetical protein
VTSAAAFAAGAAVFTASTAFSTVGRAAAYEPALTLPRSRPRTTAAAAGRPGSRRGAAYRRRRALLSITLLLAVEIVVAAFIAKVVWIGVSVTGFMLVVYVVHLRNRALLDQRRRRAEARYAEWLAAQQAAVRREQARRAAARRELLERHLSARDEARKAALRGRPYSSHAAGL